MALNVVLRSFTQELIYLGRWLAELTHLNCILIIVQVVICLDGNDVQSNGRTLLCIFYIKPHSGIVYCKPYKEDGMGCMDMSVNHVWKSASLL